MTIAQQIAHDFLASIEKVCVENKIDIGSLETSIIYDKGAQAGIAVKDAKAGIIIASMNYDLDEKSLKRKKKEKEKELEDYCIERICPICNFKKQTPCIVNKIWNEEAVEEAVTDEEIEEAYKKMLEDKNKKCQEI